MYHIQSLSASVWFHGRGTVGGRRPIFEIVRSGSWTYDQAVMYASSDTFPQKPSLYFLDGGVNSFQAADDVIPFDRWVHLAFTFDITTRNLIFYINGGVASAKIYMNMAQLTSLNQIYVGYNGGTYEGNCECDMTELEIYNSALTAEEIFQSYSRHIQGDACLGGP